MNLNLEEKNNNSEEISINSNTSSKNYSKQKPSSNQKKKRNKKNKNEKSKNNNNSMGGGILSEIKQISIPSILEEKENLFKILQSEIVNIDKGIVLLNKKKKYYDEIIQKLGDEIQKEKKDIKKNENKNQEYIYMENLLKDISINEYFENNLLDDNSFYNKIKSINSALDYNYFLLNQKNNKNYLIINFLEEKNKDKINNKMEPNYQMTYEEFNNIDDMDNNYCILMNNEMNKTKDDDNKDKNKKEETNNNEEKIIIESDSEHKENNLNLVDNTPLKINYLEEKEEFTIIDEVPAEEEDTNNKKRKRNTENELDKSIKKDYSNSAEELDFYLLKNSNNVGKNKNKNKKNLEDIEKKYKVEDMGSGFLPSESSSLNLDNSKEEKVKNKRKKKNKKNKKESDINLSESQKEEDNKEQDKNDSIEKSDDISDESKEQDNNKNKNKKKGRKKRKKDVEITFSIIEEYPDPENLDNTALSLEMKKYGMKPQNKKKNIEILKSVYNFLKIKEMPENILKNLTSFDLDNNDKDSENDNENLEGSKSENVSAMNELNDETKRKIIEIIKDNKNIYEKILLFKEISIKEIKSLLNSKGIIVPNQQLSKLLINSGMVLPGGWNNKK